MKSELVIVKGQEFKISVQDTIKEDDIFIEQYKQAADMLDAILSENQDSDKNKNNTIHLWQQTEYENNIIAFCGDRGDGKSSAMLTFINALCCKDDHKEDDEIDLFKNRIDKKTYIAEPIVIDPSQFDDVHNVLDIVLAKMYKNFNDKYQKDNRESDESKALDLLKRFQKVYRQIAMIYDQQKILDKEFDYEGNIDKLAKLGESTNLKSDFENLIIQYLEFMNNKAEISKSQLLIAIDDLDLCNQVAYKLAEQIRKYLIIPHVVIVMAVKNDQLQLAMQEKNINEYKAVIQYTGKFDNKETSNELDFEIKNMAERYVSKLIPKARRIYMPKMRNISETKISYKEKVDDKEKIIWDSNEDTLVKSVLELIHEKTGMIFLEEDTGMSYLVPDNLRDLINWISQLTKMKSVEKKRKNRNKDEEESEMEDNNLEKDGKLIEKIKKENIDKFYEIFISDWVDRELPWGWKKRFNTLEGMDVIHINANVKKMIEPLFDWDEINKAQFEQMFRWHGGERAVEFFENIPAILNKIKVLQDVGLGYIKLGQPSTTLSGGESQRVKLATELSKKDTGKTLYVLDEPTTGLHFEDIRVLLNVLNRLVDKGNTVLVIEHNLDVIKSADYIIDMGPEGGQGGGQVLATGTPEEICKTEDTYTTQYLRKELNL